MEIEEDEEVQKAILEDSAAHLEEIMAARNQISNGETPDDDDDDENFAYEPITQWARRSNETSC